MTNNADQPRDHGRFAEKANCHATPTDLGAAAANDSYQLDEWVVLNDTNGKPVMRACFTSLGEGYNGEYDPDDEYDEPLLRLDFEVPTDSDFADEDSYTGDEGWSTVVGTTSTCTNTNGDKVTPERMRTILERVLADAQDDITVNGSVANTIGRAYEIHETYYEMVDAARNDAKSAQNVCTYPGCDRNANDENDDDGTQTRCWTHDPDRAAAAVNDGGEVGELARSILAHDAGQ